MVESYGKIIEPVESSENLRSKANDKIKHASVGGRKNKAQHGHDGFVNREKRR